MMLDGITHVLIGIALIILNLVCMQQSRRIRKLEGNQSLILAMSKSAAKDNKIMLQYANVATDAMLAIVEELENRHAAEQETKNDDAITVDAVEEVKGDDVQ